MRGLTRWSPFGSAVQLQKEMDELFGRFFGAEGLPGSRAEARPTAWWPAVESYAKDGKLHVRMALPGVDPKDVEVTVVDDLLTVRGERRGRTGEPQNEYFVREMAHGVFERSFALPDGVDPAQVHARYANGMLEVTMPVQLAAAPKKVEIQIEGASSQDKAIRAA